MLEKDVEVYLRRAVELRGWKAYKFVSPGRSHVPDRIILAPGGRAYFAEVKAPGKKPREGQLREHARLRALGFDVAVVDSRASVDAWLSGLDAHVV